MRIYKLFVFLKHLVGFLNELNSEYHWLFIFIVES